MSLGITRLGGIMLQNVEFCTLYYDRGRFCDYTPLLRYSSFAGIPSIPTGGVPGFSMYEGYSYYSIVFSGTASQGILFFGRGNGNELTPNGVSTSVGTPVTIRYVIRRTNPRTGRFQYRSVGIVSPRAC